MSINYNNSGSVPAPFTSKQQYDRYLRCLQQNGVSGITSPGKFTVEQLKCATAVLGYCPPGYEGTCAKIPDTYNADTPVFSRYNNASQPVNTAAIQATSNFVPTSLKTSAGTIDPALYGYSYDLSADRYVNTTSQRVTGGQVLPLQQQLQTVDRTPKALQNYNVVDEPWAKNLSDLSGLNRTAKTVYDPAKVGSTVTVNDRTVNNLRSSFSTTTLGEGIATTNPAGGTTNTGNNTNTINSPAFSEPGVNNNNSETYVGSYTPASQLLANAPITGTVTNAFDSAGNSDNIRYNKFPIIDLTPLELSSNGNYIPAGPAARAQISAPTPEASITQEDLLGIAEGSELLINGRKIIMRGVGLTDIKSQINCKNMGIKAIEDASSNELALVSCNGAPFTIANGCGGGTYSQVGDFHVNRGFEQGTNESVTAAESMYYPLTATEVIGAQNPVALSDQTQQEGSVKEVYKYQYDFDNERIIKLDDTDFYQLPAKIPNISKTRTTTYTSGGSGYRIGDRLRLIGGTPINNTKGPLTKICIDSAGAGYSDPSELQILISTDSDSSGIGATAVVTRLDDNGGIADIMMTNWGTGYDLRNPPKIEIRDLAPVQTTVEIDASWPDAQTVPARSTVSVNVQRGVYDVNGVLTSTSVSTRYVRTTAPTVFGETVTVDHTDSSVITGISDAQFPSRAVVDYSSFSTANFENELRPNSYVNIVHYPVSLKDTATPITVDSINTGTQQVTLNVTGTIISRMRISENGIVVQDNSNNNQFIIYYNADDVNSGANTITTTYEEINGTPTIAAGDTAILNYSKEKLYWIPEPKNDLDVSVDTVNNKFVIEDKTFTNDQAIANEFPSGTPISITVKKFWAYNLVPSASGERPSLVDTVDPRINKIPAELSAKIAMRPDVEADVNTKAEDAFIDGYSGMAGPMRVAKFLVTGVDSTGGITSLRCIDRGLYKIFPSDLTFGIPLEYDIGAEQLTTSGVISADDRNHLLGVGDPARSNINYGSGHPEGSGDTYAELGTALPSTGRIVRNGPHPDWAKYPEFYWNGENFIPYSGSPGAYDPNTYVIVDPSAGSNPETARTAGRLLSKAYAVDTNPYSATFGEYLRTGKGLAADYIIPGGSGARVFITAQEVPNCNEKGQAKESLGLPDVVAELNAPQAIKRALNDALTGAGYNPDDIEFTVNDIGDIGIIELDSDFPGINIDSPTPGFLPELGLESGDYNVGMLCIEGTLEEENISDEQAISQIDQLYNSDAFGLLDEAGIDKLTGRSNTYNNPTAVLSLVCVDRLGNDTTGGGGGDDNTVSGTNGIEFGNPNTAYTTPAGLYGGPFPLNDNNSIFSDALPASISEMFKYTIVNPYGSAVTLNGNATKQNAPVNVFASKRFNINNQITTPQLTVDAIGQNALEPKAWIDDYQGTNKWAYIENGTVVEQQQNLVDVNFVESALVYDGETGNGVNQLDFWDPFKGILPGFIRNELHYITETDPVAYDSARSVFGRNNIGKTWWDTSTVRYQWYEQGTNKQRQRNWGQTFPGSSITVCEWVESKSLPKNWNGNGTPRWNNRYVTERHQNTATGEYELYYYYWVQNRTILDDRNKRNLRRELDTQTLARYIANPVGYGLNLISFVSEDSMLISNTSEVLSNKDNHLQVNFSRNQNPNGIKHTAWKLMREGDNNSTVPEELSDKLIDSLSGINAIGQEVPDTRLSEIEKYGIKFRPRQSMFKDLSAARRVMVSVINEILAGIKLNTQYPEWDATLPAERVYIATSNWYAVRRVDAVTKQNIRYDESYKPVFNVNSVAELERLTDLPDGTVVQVKSSQNDTAQLWLYTAPTDNFVQISIAGETVQLTDAVFQEDNNAVLANELRLLLTLLNNTVFASNELWNTFFFEMMKHAYTEQQQLSWAFKTSYLYIEKEEDDLVQFTGFKPDNFQKVLDYMNEVKPFNAKIREYKDGKRTPIDLIGQNNLSDYDKPPYVDPELNTVRILDQNDAADFNIMSNSSMYIDYLTVPDKSQDPIRKLNETIVFDRTNWQLTQADWNKVTTPLNQSIARNIANLMVATALEVGNNSNTRAIDRIFKFDPAVQATFIAEINTYFNDVTASSNTEIVGNADALYNVLEAGQLKLTQELVKDKVGGNFRGETLDAQEFSTIIEQVDYVNQVIDEFGFDTEQWDTNSDNDQTVFTDDRNVENYGEVTSIGIGDTAWDSTIQLVNYEGVFNTLTQNNVTLRRNNESVEGFDGVTFQRVLYGEERPEEMALFDPLESVVMTVTTSAFSLGQASFTSEYDPDDENVANVHLTVYADSVDVVNAGKGYVNPQVTFVDATNNSPDTPAQATATVDANGSITAVTVTDSGAGYQSMAVLIDNDATVRLAENTEIGTNTFVVQDNSNVLLGQTAHLGDQLLGTVTSIQGNTVVVNQLLQNEYVVDAVITLNGTDFVGEVIIDNTVASTAIIDRAFYEQQLTDIIDPADVTVISATKVSVANVTYPLLNEIAGADPHNENYAFKTGVANSWDSADTSFAPGSFDFEFDRAGSLVTPIVAPGAQTVTHRAHLTLFGNTDYLRIRPETTTELTETAYTYSTTLTVANPEFMVEPTTQQPGQVWVGSELIYFARRDGNTLSLLTRGVHGTTIQDHAVDTPVYSAEANEYFNNLNPRANVWLDSGTKYGTPSKWDQAIQTAGANTPLDPSDDVWDIQRQWDEIESANIAISADTANVTSLVSNTTAVIRTSTLTDIQAGEGLRITSTSNTSITQVVKVNSVEFYNVNIESDDDLNSTLFVQGDTVSVEWFDYGAQTADDHWDAAEITGQSAVSLADRANVDLSSDASIMRFLHKL